MEQLKIGILHPGEMGVSIAASAKNGGCTVYWVSEGRSAQTHERAQKAGLLDADNLKQLCELCSIIISVCPPHGSEDLARDVVASGFHGVYVDANAISPQRTKRIGEVMAQAGNTFVDGGIIGGPAWSPNSTRLYLSGKDAQRIASCFVSGPLETRIIGEEIGHASALKMCFAAYSKGTTALLGAILATAEAWGVRDALERQWSRDGSGFVEQTSRRITNSSLKAWRFVGEMEEIAATFDAAGLPDGFHLAAAEVYQRQAGFKDAPIAPAIDRVLNALLQKEPAHD